MTDQPKQPRKSRWLFWTVAGIAALPLAFLLYVLGFGPVAWLQKAGVISEHTMDLYATPYYHFATLLGHPRWLRELLTAYTNWWV